MPVYSDNVRLSTEGNGDIVDLTEPVQSVVRSAGAREATVSVFVPGSTAAVTLMEHERGGIHDLRVTLERLVPQEQGYEHNRLNRDTNAHAHIRAAIIGPSETVPVKDGRLATGTWQQIVLIDFDDRRRDRTVLVQVLS